MSGCAVVLASAGCKIYIHGFMAHQNGHNPIFIRCMAYAATGFDYLHFFCLLPAPVIF
jgi:hypothetical protein